MNNFFYKVNDKEYEIQIIHKRIKNIHYRFKDDHFVVSCSVFTSKASIIKGLDRFAEKLIKRSVKEKPISDDYIYLFGNQYPIAQKGKIRISPYPEIEYVSKEELLKKIKPIFLDIVSKRVEYYEKKMNLPSYRVSVRNMSTRYGSNSKKTKHITFSTMLVHYSMDIIDSVVVHELAHILVYDHSKRFYDVVYKYCPEYDRYHTKLRKGEFQ